MVCYIQCHTTIWYVCLYNFTMCIYIYSYYIYCMVCVTQCHTTIWLVCLYNVTMYVYVYV